MMELYREGSFQAGRQHIVTRRCLVSRANMPQVAMIRFVIGPEARVVPDVKAKLPGRGLWLSARREVLETAMARRVFAKAARQPVVVPVDLAQRVDDLLVRHVLDLVGLGRRAGVVVLGYEKIFAALKAGQISFLIEAHDGSPAKGLRRLSDELPVVRLFSVCALGAAVGKLEVVRLALKKSNMAKTLLLEASRLACYRGLGGYV